jgi:hypothetical protein
MHTEPSRLTLKPVRSRVSWSTRCNSKIRIVLTSQMCVACALGWKAEFILQPSAALAEPSQADFVQGLCMHCSQMPQIMI